MQVYALGKSEEMMEPVFEGRTGDAPAMWWAARLILAGEEKNKPNQTGPQP